MQAYIDSLVKNLQQVKNTDNSQAGKILNDYLPTILEDKNFLTDEQRTYDPALDYTKHTIYACVDFVIQSLVWKVGGTTPIHNHSCWCTLGVYQGEIVEDRFKQNSDETIVCTESVALKQGGICNLIPTRKDIHRLRNPNDQVAITLHFYGINGLTENSSIFREFQL